MNSTITVVVVTYNPGEELKACLESIRLQGPDVRVIIVDNDSTQERRALIGSLLLEMPFCTLLQTGANLGFARAVNIGIDKAADKSDIVLLNPDAVLDPQCLQKLSAVASASDSIGMLTPLVRSDPGVRTASAGRLPTIRAMFNHYSGLSRIFPGVRWLEGRYLFLDRLQVDRDIEWSAGCCLYIPRRTLSSIGNLSERWFMYGEDIEYCKRVLDSGKRIRIVAEAGAYHEMGVSVESEGGAVAKMWPANTYDFYCQSFSPGAVRKAGWKLVFSFGLMSRAILIPVAGKFGKGSRTRSRKLLRFALAVWSTPPSLNSNCDGKASPIGAARGPS